MSKKAALIEAIRRDILSGLVASVEELAERLDPISIGGIGKIAAAGRGSRMFRIRRLATPPRNIAEIGAPPAGIAPMGRLNEAGQSVLYLSDSPRTAFAESMLAEEHCCLSEWRVECDRLGLVSGGMPEALMAQYFANDFNTGKPPVPTAEDEAVLALFREIFTLDLGDQMERYAWSIACGRVNGFSHQSDRQRTEEVDGSTKIIGKAPFSAIVYPSVRTDKKLVNYALNDRGRSHISLHHVQWIRRHPDGQVQSLDFADSWSADGTIEWQGRAARFVLKPGERATLRKVTETQFIYETEDGRIPWFG